MGSSSALGVGRVFAKFFPLFSWVSNESGSKHWLWLHNYGHPHFYDLFLTLPQAGSRAQAQTTESKHSLSEVRDTRQVFINLLVTNHKDTISSCPRIDYFMKEIFFFLLVTFPPPGVDIVKESDSKRIILKTSSFVFRYPVLQQIKGSIFPGRIFTPALSTWREQVLSAGGQMAEAADRSPTQNIKYTYYKMIRKARGNLAIYEPYSTLRIQISS